MNKKIIMMFTVIFSGVGAYIPVLMGIDNGFEGWSILGAMTGGFVGIWVGVKIAKRY